MKTCKSVKRQNNVESLGRVGYKGRKRPPRKVKKLGAMDGDRL